MTDRFLLVIVRQHQRFTKSPFNSYTRTFVGDDLYSAEDKFWLWWNSLDDKSYTKRMCKVHFIWCTMDEVNPLNNPRAKVIPLKAKDGAS